MGNDTVKRICGCCVLHRSKVKIRSFTGYSVQVLGTMGVNMMFWDRLVKARIMVTEYQHNLLGRDLIDKMGVLTVNLVNWESDTDTVTATLDRHPKLFQEEWGKLKGVQVNVDGDTAPIFFKQWPLPYATRRKLEEELQRLEQSSNWTCEVFRFGCPHRSSPEAQWTSSHLCGDYKMTVNKASTLEQYPIPTFENLITKLGKGSVYRQKLYLSHAYSQIELEPESRSLWQHS